MRDSFTEVLADDVMHAVCSAVEWLKCNVKTLSLVVVFLMPVSTCVYFEGVYSDGHSLMIGPMTSLSLILLVLLFLLYKVGEYYGNSKSGLPVPYERFTEVDEYGTYVEKARLEELVQYTAELEDWLESNGYM